MAVRIFAVLSLAMVALGVPAQMASSATHELETLAITGGGGHSVSATHQLEAAVGQSTPLAAAVTQSSLSNRAQPGLIPILYPRTLLGDANDDGARDAADIVTAVEIGGGGQPTPANIVHFFNADANTDNRVDASDAAAIAGLLLGL